jgi:hypothetical protein
MPAADASALNVHSLMQSHGGKVLDPGESLNDALQRISLKLADLEPPPYAQALEMDPPPTLDDSGTLWAPPMLRNCSPEVTLAAQRIGIGIVEAELRHSSPGKSRPPSPSRQSSPSRAASREEKPLSASMFKQKVAKPATAAPGFAAVDAAVSRVGKAFSRGLLASLGRQGYHRSLLLWKMGRQLWGIHCWRVAVIMQQNKMRMGGEKLRVKQLEAALHTALEEKKSLLVLLPCAQT